VNRKRVHRVYKGAGLQVRRRRPRRALRGLRQPIAVPSQVNERWSMDFMSDMLVTGRRIRILNIVDDCSRECLASYIDLSIPARSVMRVLDELAASRGLPARIVMDNGSEFASRALQEWAERHGVQLCFIEPGKPS
jgi:putative transposase